jgi:ketosteroid isomerase-like protein
VDFAAAAERFMSYYNAKDFDRLAAMTSPDLDFAHFNRDFTFKNRDALLDVLRQFGSALAPDRKFLPPERVTVSGNVVVREAYWVATAQVDLPGFGNAGSKIRLRFCSVMRFDDNGVLVEWKDYG